MNRSDIYKETGESINYQDWEKKFYQELKRSGLQDRNQQTKDRMKLAPIYAESLVQSIGKERISWLRGINFGSGASAQSVQSALMQGIDAPLFRIDHSQDTKVLLEGVIDEYVQTILEFSEADQIQDTLDWLESSGRANSIIWLSGDGVFSERVKCLVRESIGFGEQDMDRSLADILCRCVTMVKANGIDVLKHMVVRLVTTKDYYSTISKFLAMRILWSNLLAALQLEATSLWIDALIPIDEEHYDQDHQLILSTGQLISAILGLADRVAVQSGTSSKYQRLHINIQQLLRLESLFDRYPYPSSGSYYFENVSEQIAASAWEIFKKTAGGM